MSKTQGELVELKFLIECLKRKIKVAIVYGDNAPYDCVTDGKKGLLKVQVKSTSRKEKAYGQNRFHLSCAHGAKSKKPYHLKDTDIIAAYIIPEEAWYLIPIAELNGKKTLALYPHRQTSRAAYGKYEKWKERWDIL